MSKKLHKQRMRKVLHAIEQYSERKPTIDLDVKKLADIACYSQYHFHRVFRAFTGESVNAYVTRIRLQHAVIRLKNSSESITSIALDSGYDNLSAFNKAFKKNFNVTASQVRKLSWHNIAPNNQAIHIGESNMKATIINRPDTSVICARATGNYQESTAKAWQKIMSFAYGKRLMSKDVQSIGISHDDPTVTDAEHIRYDACLTLVTDIEADDELYNHTIAGGIYAQFLHKGSYDKFPDAYASIFNNWLPESDYQLRDEVCFEIYLNRDPRRTKPENLRTEIYIPLQAK